MLFEQNISYCTDTLLYYEEVVIMYLYNYVSYAKCVTICTEVRN